MFRVSGAVFSLLICLMLLAFDADAAPSVSIAGLSPLPGVQLPSDRALYLRLSYTSDQPIRVQVHGYRAGTEVETGARWNASPAYPAGSGEALVWISYTSATRIDELRVEVHDASWQPLLVLKVPSNAVWSGFAGSEPGRPDWVARLSKEQQQRISDSNREEAESSATGIAGLIGWFALLSVPGYFVLQAFALMRYSGGWWFAAVAPLLVMVPATVHAALALSMGSNIWPIVVILAAPPLFLYLCVVGVARFVRQGAFI